MSNFPSIQSRTPLDLLTKPEIGPQKQASRTKNPLSSALNNPLSEADKASKQKTKTADDIAAAQERIDKAKLAAEGLVSTTFIEPILKQVRESNHTPPPFGPSNAEKQFSALLDTRLADDIVHAANFPLVQRITDQLLRNMPSAEPQERLDIQG
jgi:Rod binding domain-containing protein